MWVDTNEAVRDLHRTILPRGSSSGHSRSHEVLLPESHRAIPEVGTASQLAKPGGFRRDHVHRALGNSISGDLAQYAATPVFSQLWVQSFTGHFLLTDVIQVLQDGTQIRWESRRFRRGRRLEVIRTASGDVPESPPLRLCGFRPLSVPYWVSVSFLFGGLLFAFGSFAWMIPAVGDANLGAPDWQAGEGASCTLHAARCTLHA